MKLFQFFQFLNNELVDVMEYHTEKTTMFIKEVHMEKGVTRIVYEELSMDGFKVHEISIPNSRLIK
jgi:hypothetical protein